ncbi:MAG: VCBS repeat-containing protein [Candidatus Omnitrophica bacterium]|nr:VCBS repeat-containing protein [Candidatus Omnitrophota bacterium]
MELSLCCLRKKYFAASPICWWLLFCVFLTQAQGDPPVWKRVHEGVIDGVEGRAYGPNLALGPFLANGDIDSDGDEDLFIGGWRYVRFLRNDGTASRPRWTYVDENYFNLPNSGIYPCPALADIDDDGDLDFFYGHWNGIIYFYRNQGDPFTPDWQLETTTFAGINVGAHARPVFVDMDADRDLDLLVAHPGAISYYRNDRTVEGTWSFTLVSSNYTGVGSTQDSIFAEDLDLDGDYDLIQSGNSGLYGVSAPMWVIENIGSAQSPSWATPDPDAFQFLEDDHGVPVSLVFFDQDGDSDRDMICAGEPGYMDYYERSGPSENPVFTRRTGVFPSFCRMDSRSAFGDLDNDGDQDFIVTYGIRQQILLCENEGTAVNARWKSPRVIASMPFINPNTDAGYISPALGDIDADGDLDLLIGWGYNSGRVAYYENISGNLTYQTSDFVPQHPTSNTFLCPTLCDIDADGDLDLFVGCRTGSSAQVRFYRNLALSPQDPPNWTIEATDYVSITVAAGYNNACPTFSDVDQDGDFDLFVGVGHPNFSSANTEVNYFENIGDATTAVWGTRVDDYLDVGGYDMGKPELVDIDNDGDLDFFYAERQPGISLWKNEAEKLNLSPNVRTVVTGGSLSLSTTAAIDSASWTTLEDRSGLSLTPSGNTATYVAGATAGVVDVIEIFDASETIGRAHINVISATDVSQVGEAIIVAGRRSDPDPVWPATDYLAQFAFRTCLLKGFDKDQVNYLSPVVGIDVDGNGDSGDDIDALTTLANLETAIQAASGANELTLFLVDHGFDEDSAGRFQMNENGEVLTAEQLDSWLDSLQSSSSLKVRVIIDSCKSGAFVSALLPPSGKERIVVTSSSGEELTYFLGQGLISFSEAFWNGIYTGLSIGDSFEFASAAINRYQSPQLDDDSDGVFDPDMDGLLAKTSHIGLSSVAGSDRPQIGSVNPNQTISGTDTFTLWAKEISSTYPIKEVWAIVIPPDFTADPDTNDPVIDLPTQEFVYNGSLEQWETTYSGFDQTGTYKIVIYSRDIWNSVSLPKQIYIHRTDFTEKAILLVGEGGYGSGQPFANSNAVGTLAYRTMRSRWFGPDDIDYFNPVSPQDLDEDSVDDVDASPTLAGLETAIMTSALGSEKLTVCLIGQGSTDSLKLNGTEDLSSTDLDTWLDSYQTTTGATAVVVLEFQESGSWVDDLIPPAGTTRVVITSAAPGYQSYCYQGGIFSFSQYFWNGVFLGENLRDSFRVAQPVLRELTLGYQLAAMTDDGDGIVNEKADGLIARTLHIGPGFLTGGDDTPTIGEVADTIYLATGEDTATVWCASVFDSDGIRSVTATFVSPEFPSDPPVSLPMVFNGGNSRYEATYSGFIKTGTYAVVYAAEDNEGNVSSDVFGTVFQYGDGDAYEVDDTSVDATQLVIDYFPHKHNFHDNGDEDWTKFYAESGVTYTIWVDTTSANCDPVLTVYDGPDLGTPIGGSPIDDGIAGEEEKLFWTAPSSGEYFIQVVNYDPAVYGHQTDYRLSVIKEFGLSNGMAIPISSSAIRVTWDPSVSEDIYGYQILRSSIDYGPYTVVGNLVGADDQFDDTGLEPETTYFYQVHEIDNGLNARELTSHFFTSTLAEGVGPLDTDNDGVLDVDEDAAPNDGDGNNDSAPDSEQSNVVSLPNAVDGRYVTLISPTGTSFTEVEALSDAGATPPDAGLDFPIGFFAFKINGVSPGTPTRVELLLPSEVNVDTYYRYGLLTGDVNPQWYNFTLEGNTGATFETGKILLYFIDGERGDDDRTENGQIVDPGGPTLGPSAVFDWAIY